ncbi:Putative purine permease [Auxenochlorella protothecoides]|uniref:Putative purine permease n=1 Tax=Auxenochlorella protothecoides TaxID=3075 RepID=A0A087SI11_AUXPR|nr:Putative purine permease [Auxenochlorella protothecoides]KFM25365.1 Putative purine permease [Auxenochlorella protothecoides]
MGRFMTAWREKRYNYILLGDYDYKYLCMPVWPFKAGKRDPPTFFATDAWLGILTAMVMGLQHAMAMVGGLITDLETLARVSGRPYEAENYTFPTQSQLDEEEDGPDLGEEEEVEVLTGEEEDELDSIAAALSS